MTQQPTKRFIVAEASKNWTRGQVDAKPLLCQEFEKLINVNASYGYTLHSFALHQLMVCQDPEVMTETIIAVFERKSE